ncbi:MAG TPA: glycerol-3-phosphate 1-O-acyltransferase PlsY [Vicinamibacterales bacterium]|jgi:glycerol-3-phosphate acyltransferase PlsY|nr:glycerol-3-phosphate 1-O-acyltransferase PlsY [Vicinamibacterales bacterium]
MIVADAGAALPVAAGYLLGSIPFAVLVTRRAGVDILQQGSGNPGATNVARTSGLGAGAAVAALDIAKGALSVVVAQQLTTSSAVAAAAGLAAVVGHVFPVWLRFKGGKGVATACGAFAVLAPSATALAGSVFFVTAFVTRYISLGSIVAAAALPSFAYITHAPTPVVVASFGVATLVIARHRSNVTRLLAHTEPRV